MLIFSYISAWTSSVKELSTHEATVLMNKDDAIVLDTRPAKDKPIIVVCAMGNQARGTANAMLKDGFANVSVLKGGMNAWQSASLPVSK